MNRNAFKQLLKRYVTGVASEEEKLLIDHWYELLYNDNISKLNDAELLLLEQEIWDKIEEEALLEHDKILPIKTPFRKNIFKWAAAAAVFIGISLGIYIFTTGEHSLFVYQENKLKSQFEEVINTSSVTKRVSLEDGTVITLQPSSKIAYPHFFSKDKREVYLEGEAFFDVAKNPAKPFLVHSGNLLTQVLGTSFTIKPDKKSNKITVAVKTGRVAVFEDNKQVTLNTEQQKNNGAIITPNQKIVYDVEKRNFITSLVENPEPVLQEHPIPTDVPASFTFDETYLSSVFEHLGKIYAIDIVVENENIYKCRFSGDISRQSLYDKLELICQSTNHQYEVKGTKILIKGKGCN